MVDSAQSTRLGAAFLPLQDSQTALLNFRGMSFPHVTVGTLIEAFSGWN